MELKTLRIKNFLGIGYAEVNFDKKGLTLIEGKNNDSPSSISNGAGKSSIFEALFWVLFGKTKRGLTGNDVINRTAKKNCVVDLEFDDYAITRTRKEDDLGTTLKLWQRNPDGPEPWMELTKGTVKETQALVEEVTKMSELTFSKVAYFGQEDVKAFASLTDAELKKVFEQALGVTFLSAYQGRAKVHRADLASEIREGYLLEANKNREAELVKEKKQSLEKAKAELKAKREKELKRLYDELGDIEGEIHETEKLHKILKSGLTGRYDSIEAQLKRLVKLEESKAELQAKHREKLAEISKAKGLYDYKLDIFKERFNELQNAPKKIGESCDKCDRPYTKEDIRPLIEKLGAALKEKQAELKAFEESIDKLQAGADDLEKLFKPLNAEIEKLSEAKTELGRIESDKIRLKEYERTLDSLAEKAKRYLKAISDLEDDKSDYMDDIRAAGSELIDIQTDVERIQADVKKLEADFEIAEALEEILGNGGLKSYIFDSITPELNRTIDKYIKILDDIEIEVSTVTKLKSGDYREKFSIKVDNPHGASQYNGNSGGEKQKCNLAVAMGFNTILRTMSEGAVNAIFLDEPFESLDEGSSEKVIELCESFTGFGNVFLITHQQGVKDLIANRIVVEKNGGMANIKET
jgi:DNA repair exonuclease SbcCD ATPase subunit